jgi:hypothetical protein
MPRSFRFLRLWNSWDDLQMSANSFIFAAEIASGRAACAYANLSGQVGQLSRASDRRVGTKTIMT